MTHSDELLVVLVDLVLMALGALAWFDGQLKRAELTIQKLKDAAQRAWEDKANAKPPAVTIVFAKHYFAEWDREYAQPWVVHDTALAGKCEQASSVFFCYTVEDAQALMQRLDELAEVSK